MEKRYKVTILVLCLLLLCFVGVGVWYWFNNVKDDDCVINDNKYSFLNDYFVGKENGICKYKVKGIIYNVDSENKSYDFNLWDIKDKESLYYEGLDIVSEVNDMSLFKEYSAVDVSYGFRNGNLDNISLSKAVLSEAEYMDAFSKVFTVINGDYTSEVEIDNDSYPVSIPSTVVLKDGKISVEVTTYLADAMYKALAYSSLNGIENNPIKNYREINIVNYINDVKLAFDYRHSVIGSDENIVFPYACVFVNKVFDGTDDIERDGFVDYFCDMSNLFDTYVLSGNTMSDLVSYYSNISLGYDDYGVDKYLVDDMTDLFGLLPDVYAYDTNLSIGVEDMIVSIVLDEKQTLSTLCPLGYALSLTEEYTEKDEYRVLYDEILAMLKTTTDPKFLLQELEQNISSGLYCFDAFGDDETISNLVYAELLKYYYFNVYDVNYDGKIYSGLWSLGNIYVDDITTSMKELIVRNNSLYFKMLLSEYEK